MEWNGPNQVNQGPDYQGPQHPQQVQQVQYVQQPQQQQQQQQQYQQGPPPPPPQQEQVIYQTLQTPHQQQQQQPPQYTRVILTRPQAPQQQHQQQQHVPPPQQQYHHQQQPAQQQHYQYQQQQRNQYPPQQQQQQQQQQYHYVQHPQQQPQHQQHPQQQQQQQQRPQQGQTVRIIQTSNAVQVSGSNAIPVGRVVHTVPRGVGPDGKPQYVIRLNQQQGQQFIRSPQQGQGQPRVLQVQRGVRPGQQFRMLNQQRQPHAPQQQHGHRPLTLIRHPVPQGQVRYMRQPMPGQQQQQMHYIQHPQQRPPLPPQQPPQPPPPQPEPQQNEIQYNIEHVFEENGKKVRKMPINLNGQTIWVDCAEQPSGDQNNSVMLDLDTGNTVTSTTSDSGAATASPSPTANLPKPVSTRRSIKELTEEEKNQIIEDCCVRLISPQVLSNKYALSVQAIRTLVKDSGRALPAKYNSKAEHGPKSRKTPPGVQELIPNLPTRVEDIENRSIHSASQQSRFQSSFEDFTNSFTQSLLKSNQPPSQPGIQPKDDNTITLYPGAPSEGSLSPPAQVVRHQLVVTDNNAGMQNGQGTNQLQLPQKPTPPMGLPKPVPAQAKVPPLPVQPKTIPGKVAVCPNCGGYSVHIDRCQMCKKVIKEGAKIMPDPDYKPPITSSSSSLDDSKKPPQDLRNIRIQPKVGRRKTNNDEPEMISLSSDEEDANEDDNEAENGESRTSSNENTSSSVNDSGDKSEASKTEDDKGEKKKSGVNAFQAGPGTICEPRIMELISNLQTITTGDSTGGQFTTLTCRSIRIGSYKILTKEKVYFTQKAIYLKIPYLTDPDRLITIVVPLADILKIEMLSGRSMPLLFISTTPSTCERVRKDLNLNFKSSGLYYDLSSVEESMKRITMLPEKMPDEVKTILSGFYSNTITELDSKTANEMLVKSTPKTSIMQEQQRLQAIKKLDPDQKLKPSGPKIEKYCQYPATGSNTVSISPEDYYCLEDESFLNDVIIDFYLKWIQNTVIPQESRDRTHIFTTYFYKRLTTRPPRSKNKLHPIEDNVNLSAAEKRYERVRRWTKKVNIFEKDFVIIPINEHSHWFLAVICYPGLISKCRMDTGEPIPDASGDDKKPSESLLKSKTPKKKVMQIGSTSIIPLKSNSSFHLDDDSDRDEADASDSDMVIEDDFLGSRSTRSSTPVEKSEKSPVSKEENTETDPLEDKPESPKAPEETGQEPKESEDQKETPEQMETEEEAKETEDSNEVEKSEESKELKNSVDSKETEDSKEPKEIEDSKGTMETEDSKEVKETEDSKESLETEKVSEEFKEIKEEKVAEESNESKEPSIEESKTETKVEEDDDSEYKASKYFESGAENDKEASNAKPEESQSNGTSESNCDESVAKPSEKEETKESVIAVKQPCILIFDSLQTGLRSRVVATLREYLKCEYKTKLDKDREFDKDNFKGFCPKVPQQPNFSDCGLFALQYAESFFKTPIADFALPISGLRKWFSSDVMRSKRSDIAKIIRELTEQQNPKLKIDFPIIGFTPDSGSGYTDDEDDTSFKSNSILLKPAMKPKFFVKSTNSGASPSTTRVICLTTSAASKLGVHTKQTTSSASSPGMMIQKRKGKIEYFKIGSATAKAKLAAPAVAGNIGPKFISKESPGKMNSIGGVKTPTKKLIIPKLIKSTGDKSSLLKKTPTPVKSMNGPKLAPASEPAKDEKLVHYSDSDDDKVPEPLDMEIDEDGAPVLPAPVKRCNEDNEASQDAKRVKSDQIEGAIENDA